MSRQGRKAASTLLLLAILAPVASARGQRPSASADSALAARLDPAVRTAIASAVEAAHSAGLPVRALVDKSLEGQSKQASPDRIAAAVRGLLGELLVARDALGPKVSENDLVAAASALHAGASPAVLVSLERARGGGALAVPLAVLAELVARGVSVDTAASAVVALARRGVRDAEFVGLRQDVEHDVALGAPPSLSTAIRAADLDGATTLGASPASVSHSPRPTPLPPSSPPTRP